MISPEVMRELLAVRQILHYLPVTTSTDQGWTEHEQHLFWVALAQHPQGPWSVIAAFIGTKSTRQTMTHGQKLRQKFYRWHERLRQNPTASMLMDGVSVSTQPESSFAMVEPVAPADPHVAMPLSSSGGMARFPGVQGHPNISAGTARVVELMMSDTFVEEADAADGLEMLPQDLLDELFENLTDEDFAELSQAAH